MNTANARQGISRFWRAAFWTVLIHFVLTGFPAWANWVPLALERPGLTAFHAASVGLGNAAALWLFINSPWLWCAWLATDVAALRLSWRLARRPASRTRVATYLCLVIGSLAAHAGGVLYAGSVEAFYTPKRTYAVGEAGLLFALIDLWLALPACLILAGVLVRQRPRHSVGLCPICGYDLRATPTRCPECGHTPPPPTRHSS